MKLRTKYHFTTASLLLFSLFSAGASAATTGLVSFEGKVLPNTCHIDSNHINQTVKLENVTMPELPSVNSTAQSKEFFIKVENCSLSDGIPKIGFTATIANSEGENLKNIASGGDAATGVAIQLLDGLDSYNAIKLDPSQIVYSKGKAISGSDNSSNFPFKAQYIATSSTITFGSVKGEIEVSIAYN